MDKHTLLELGQEILQSKDQVNASKMQQLNQKLMNGRLNLAFCGHFSAGKSTLINKLCGYPLLPSSPIPTSANVVTILNGDAQGIVYRRSEEGLVKQKVDLDELDQYCKNGEMIDSVEICYPIPLLGNEAALLDTPGIDSTDQAHMMATESALHLADVVFYVMDYNHVQSEMNFTFVKRLKEWDKPVYLIVNQIDKHREEELSFEIYKQGVEEAFLNWGIPFDGIVYLSLKVPSHPHHEWGKLQWLVKELLTRRTSLTQWNVKYSAKQIIHNHANWIRETNEDERRRLQQELDGQRSEKAILEYEHATTERTKLLAMPEQQAAKWLKSCEKILDNANITPASTRDLAQAYLESRKPGFKVGWFGGAVKTAQEVDRRLQAFHASYSEELRTHVIWHLISEWKREAELHGLQPSILESTIVSMNNGIQLDWLANQVSTGAVVSGEYTLNYTKQVAADTKIRYRRFCLEAIDTLRNALQCRVNEEVQQLDQQLEKLSRELEAYLQLQALDQRERNQEEALLQKIGDAKEWAQHKPSLPDLHLYRINQSPDTEENVSLSDEWRQQSERSALATLVSYNESDSYILNKSDDSTNDMRERSLNMVKRLTDGANLLKGLPGLQSITATLEDRAQKLLSNRFTVALFGAFSAGKSSFANALIGERLLPVSPNPTTAAINTIVPPTLEYPHATAIVRMKEEQALRDEVRHSLSLLGIQGIELENLTKWLDTMKPEHVVTSGKPHFTFLQAVGRGWQQMLPSFGQELVIGLDRFSTFVADEAYSCFVQSIELHYQHPLADQGVVLVDTPGADSINARHTGVAFNYLKNADAILFVTYYNHAFSQADREFLMQLGRVKDALEMDKMFFIVNAADLASSVNELEEVCKHVETNLIQHGIRQPRLYPVSSQLAVDAKVHHDPNRLIESGFSSFEQAFRQFAFTELGGLALHAAQMELNQAIQLLEDFRYEAESGEDVRKQKLSKLVEDEQSVKSTLNKQSDADGLQIVDREVRELLYYVKQRIGYRFGEWYNYSFNPSSLREDGRDIKASLRACWTQLCSLLSVALSQEVLATTLLLDKKTWEVATKHFNKQADEIGQLWNGFLTEAPRFPNSITPEIDEDVHIPLIDVKRLYVHFKNGKSFFEGEGKANLRLELTPLLELAVSNYVDLQLGYLLSHYSAYFDKCLRANHVNLQRITEDHIIRRRSALEQQIDLSELNRIYRTLRDLTLVE
jgi:small GTP-binding protein